MGSVGCQWYRLGGLRSWACFIHDECQLLITASTCHHPRSHCNHGIWIVSKGCVGPPCATPTQRNLGVPFGIHGSSGPNEGTQFCHYSALITPILASTVQFACIYCTLKWKLLDAVLSLCCQTANGSVCSPSLNSKKASSSLYFSEYIQFESKWLNPRCKLGVFAKFWHFRLFAKNNETSILIAK